jgi:hypothetical protein
MNDTENILTDFASFVEKSAAAMVNAPPQNPPSVGLVQRAPAPNPIEGTPAPQGGAGISATPKPAAPLAKAKF